MRFQILITKGRKIIERHQRDSYYAAMDLLDSLQDTLAPGYKLEFKDTNPFVRD